MSVSPLALNDISFSTPTAFGAVTAPADASLEVIAYDACAEPLTANSPA
jgi:hypothetical protein